MMTNTVRFSMLLCAGLLSCGSLTPPAESLPDVRFSVFNTGQGLAQLLQAGDGAMVFDCGGKESADRWVSALSSRGVTRINALIISHSHSDHWGGLQGLVPGKQWDGCVVTNPYADTGLLRDSLKNAGPQLRFRILAAGDTLALGGVDEIRCLWPPREGLTFTQGDFANHTSLVFSLRAGRTSVLITADVDSSAMRRIRIADPVALKADILVVPHHGSAGSLDLSFYGWVRPEFAVVSAGINNTYGHPAPVVLGGLSQTGARILETALDGDCFFTGNGFLWSLRLNNEGP